jgi:serine/threonine-protein kinase RsbW
MSEPRDTDARVALVPQVPQVRLTIPARPRYLRLARLMAAGLASELGYSMDSIEDLRIAVDELCTATIDGADDLAELELTYSEQHGALAIEGTCRAASLHTPAIHRMARELLDMLAEEYSIAANDGSHRFRLLTHDEVPS